MEPTPRYRLDPFLLEPATRVLSDAAGEDVHLAQKPFLVLLHLVENRHRLVTRAELLERFWSGGDVYDQALTRCLSHVRKALDDQADPPRYIETRWAEGYRYIGPCTIETGAPAVVSPTPAAALPPSPHAPSAAPVPIAASAPSHAARRFTPRMTLGLTLALVAVGAGAFGLWRSTRHPELAEFRRIAVVWSFAGSGDDAWIGAPLAAQMTRTLSRVQGLELLPGDAGRDGPVDAMLSIAMTLDADALVVQAELTAPNGIRLWDYQSHDPRAELMKAERHLMRAFSQHSGRPVNEPPPRARSETSYLHLLKGFLLLEDRTCTDPLLDEAQREFETMLAADPGYSLALAGTAEAELRRSECGGTDDDAARARRAAEAAVQDDPHLARAHGVLGELAFRAGDATAARTHLERAVTLDPSDAVLRRARARLACAERRFPECIADAALAAAMSPASPAAAADHIAALTVAGRAEAAAAVRAAALARWPGDPRFGG